MRLTLTILALSSVAFSAHAQVLPVAITLDSPTTQIYQQIQNENAIQDTMHFVNLVAQATKQAHDLDQTFQYQMQSVQQLSKGTWDGFINAYGYETQAVNGFSTTVNDFNHYDDANLKEMLANPQFQSLNQQLAMTAHSMNATNAALLDTNTLMQNTQQRMAQGAQIATEAQQDTNRGALAQSQLLNQQLGLLQGETTDSKMLLFALAKSNEVHMENDQIIINQQHAAARQLLASNGGKGYFDQISPQDYWKNVIGPSWTGN